MNILVLSPPFVRDFCRSQRWPVVNRARALRYPDWLAYATALLEADTSNKVRLHDYIAEDLPKEHLPVEVDEFQADMVVFDVTTPSIYNDIECARLARSGKRTPLTVFVGPHCTVFPEETLRKSNGAVDIVCRGEYDHILREIARAVNSGNSWKSVRGIAFLEGETYRENPRMPLIEDLDALPFASWKHLNVKNYVNSTYLYPYLDIIAGRGCPNQCTFCQWPQVMMGRRYRLRSAKNVVDEMERNFREFKVKEVFFEDDTITVDKDRLLQVCDEIERRDIKMTWSCNSRCDFVDEGLMSRMKRAGCRMLLVGIESGCPQILDNVHKRLRLETVREFVRVAKKAGLRVHSCWVMGLPGETEETMRQTIEFALELDTDTLQVSGAMPQVGTEFYDYCAEKGYLKTTDWDRYVSADGEQIPLIEYPGLSRDKINTAVDELLRRFYFSPRRVFRLIRALRSPSEMMVKARGAWHLLKYSLLKARATNRQLKT